MDTIGDRLRAERDRLGLSQAAFGDLGGVQKVAQINYEKGKRHPDAEYLAAIAAAGVDVMFVITGVQAHPQALSYVTESGGDARFQTGESNAQTSAHLPADEQLLLEAYREMGTAKRKALLADLLTGGKKTASKSKGAVTISGTGHRVAGRDYHE